jgi:peroxiredoxin
MDAIAAFEAEARLMRERAAQRATPERQAALEDLIARLERTLVRGSLPAGGTAPDFELTDAATGIAMRLSWAVRKAPVVLSFYRGQWCPYCNLEVRALESIAPRVRELGGDIYLIGPETAENALKLREKTASTLPLLFDADAAVCRSYGLAFELPEFFHEIYRAAGNDLPAANPGAGWTLPIPATFVVGPERRVVASYVNSDYRYRMEPAAVLAAVESAASAYVFAS